jgi:hypothetical protein
MSMTTHSTFQRRSLHRISSAKAPEGQQSHWVSMGGEDFFLMFRLYGPGEAAVGVAAELHIPIGFWPKIFLSI